MYLIIFRIYTSSSIRDAKIITLIYPDPENSYTASFIESIVSFALSVWW